jgi:hypothetical protein
VLAVVSLDCVVVPVADWSPVVAVDALLPDWLPVVVVAVVLADWSPVEVVLSIDRLERPRRSIFGLKVEVEPVSEEFTSVEEPVTDEDEPAVEPVTVGLVVALWVELAVVSILGPNEALDAGALLEGTEPVVEACESGMQSWCTGLAECSFAFPVSLSASLPALGWFNVLQSGFVAVAVVSDLALVPVLALSVTCAHAGAAKRAAATAAVR